MEFFRQLFMADDAPLKRIERRFVEIAQHGQFGIDLFLQQEGLRGFAIDRRDFMVDGHAVAVELLGAAQAGLQRQGRHGLVPIWAGGRAIRSASKVRAAFASPGGPIAIAISAAMRTRAMT